MSLALKQAETARLNDEVPIGAIIVKDNKVISKAYNLKEKTNDPLGHAEIIAIKKATKKLKSWRLIDCKIYVTIEPCLMCMGAIINARISEVIYGIEDPKGGACSTIIDINSLKEINHHPKIKRGILKEECQNIIKDYFKTKRGKK